MKTRVLAGALGILVLATIAPAHADPVRRVRLDGTATMELVRKHSYWEPYDVDAQWAQIRFEVSGLSTDASYEGVGFGTATITRGDEVTSLQVSGSLRPPLGSGGLARLGGVDAQGNDYCFEIWDLSDAPTPRPDSTIAAFMPAADEYREIAEYSVQEGGVYTAIDLCADLLYREKSVQAGDYTIAFEEFA